MQKQTLGWAEICFGALKVLGLEVALIEKVYLVVDPGNRLIQQAAAQLSAIWNVTERHSKLQGGNSFS